jgi:hypothetical protein
MAGQKSVISNPFKLCPKKATNGRRFDPEYFQDELVTSNSAPPGPVPARQAKSRPGWRAVRWRGAISVLLVGALANETARTAGAARQEA